MKALTASQISDIDQQHIWHPYAAMPHSVTNLEVACAEGVNLRLRDGRKLVDGMSSWWCAIHGYNNPTLNNAVETQLGKMAHVMFGGLTHEPAARLAQQLIELTPEGLDRVFFCDSGSVGIEVAIKMALQYWQSQGRPEKHRLMALKGGYHGDTFGAMSVCDPITGMHHLFARVLPEQVFAEIPGCRFGAPCSTRDIQDFEAKISTYADELAAVVLEPIVQGAGGMRFYSADYLRRVRALCDRHDVLLIADEIATGFGRTGKLFACEWAGISPDIMTVGKALTGGYMTLAATLCTERVSNGICDGTAGVLMHGPTFMANPLACAVANASIELLTASPWADRIRAIEKQLTAELAPCTDLPGVRDVRVLGAIGVIEMEAPVDVPAVQGKLVAQGVWLRPFGQLIYTMPPYVISQDELHRISSAIIKTIKEL